MQLPLSCRRSLVAAGGALRLNLPYCLLLPRLRLQRGGDSAGGASAQLSDAQLNELLARGEDEAELFAAEDARLQVSLHGCRLVHREDNRGEAGKGEDARLSGVCKQESMPEAAQALRLLMSGTCMPLPLPQAAEAAGWHASHGGAAAARAAAGAPYSRLASEAAVAPLVAQAQELLQPKKDPDEGELQAAGQCPGAGCQGSPACASWGGAAIKLFGALPCQPHPRPAQPCLSTARQGS